MKKHITIICITLITIVDLLSDPEGTPSILLWIGYGIWKLWTGSDDEAQEIEEIHLVYSRDSGPVSAHLEEKDAEKERTAQEKNEEMAGGRPSVSVITLKIE